MVFPVITTVVELDLFNVNLINLLQVFEEDDRDLDDLVGLVGSKWFRDLVPDPLVPLQSIAAILMPICRTVSKEIHPLAHKVSQLLWYFFCADQFLARLSFDINNCGFLFL